MTNFEIPGYRFLSRLGTGAQASVFKAEQTSMSRPVAIKVIPADEGGQKTDHARFLREARVLAKLRHENIVRAIDYGEHRGLRYLVMEFIEGTPVQDLIQEEGGLEIRRSIEIVIQICRALEHAAKFGVIHRDIKPANIVITGESRAVLVDFGLARSEGPDAQVTIAGMTLGTPHYMPPEQIKGDDRIDGRADIYALGGTFFHMLTGQAPFPWQSRPEIMAAHLREEVQLPADLPAEIPDFLFNIVTKAMEKAREDRYRTPGDMVADLVAAVERLVPNGMESGSMGLELITEVNERPRTGPSLKERIARLSVEKKRLAREKDEIEEQLVRTRARSRDMEEKSRLDLAQALREKQEADERLAAFTVDLRSNLDRLEKLEELVRERDREVDSLESRARAAEERAGGLARLVEGLETDHRPAPGATDADAQAALEMRLEGALADRNRLSAEADRARALAESLAQAELERDRTAAREASLRATVEGLRSSAMDDQARHGSEVEKLVAELDAAGKASRDMEQQLETLRKTKRPDPPAADGSGAERDPRNLEDLQRRLREAEENLGRKEAEAAVSEEAAEAAIGELERRIEESNRDQVRMEQQIAELSDSLALLEAERDEATAASSPAQIEELTEARDRLAREIGELRGALGAAEEERREAEARAASAEEAIAEAAREKIEAERRLGEETVSDYEIEDLIARFRESAMTGKDGGQPAFGVDEAERIAAYTLRRMDALKSRLETLEREHEEESERARIEKQRLDSERQKFKTERRKTQAELKRLTGDVESALAQRRDLAREKMETDGRLKRLTTELLKERKTWAGEREKLGTALKDARSEREAAAASLSEMRKNQRMDRIKAALLIRRLRSEAGDLKAEVGLLRRENRALQNDREEIAAMISESIVISDLLDDELLLEPDADLADAEKMSPAVKAGPKAEPAVARESPAEPETTRMAYVSRGVFIAGEESGAHLEKPREKVELVAFWIDIHPVTNRQYAEFAEATGAAAPEYWRGPEPPEDLLDHPVVWVSWHEASAYAAWAGKRLPTPHEWQKAARGTDGRAYPWGNEADVSRLNCRETGFFRATAVCQFRTGVSPYGLYDMGGNVVEWVLGKFAARGPEGTPRVTRAACGGSWRDPLERSMCASRRGYPDQGRGGHVGFRCARDAATGESERD